MQAVYSKSIHTLFVFLLATAYAGAASHNNQAEEDILFLVFNQPGYAPGDTAYFTGYLIKGKEQLAGKHMVSIKLFGRDKELIHHERVLFQNGIGVSQFIIPQNTMPGNYQFISYRETSSFTKRPVFYSSYISISNENILLSDDLRAIHSGNDTSRLRIVTDRDEYGREVR
jgi:hypothetical protein